MNGHKTLLKSLSVVLLLTVISLNRIAQTESSYHQSLGWTFLFHSFYVKVFPLQLNTRKIPVLPKPHPTTQGNICCVGCDADWSTIIRWDHLRTIFRSSAWALNPAHVTFDGQWSVISDPPPWKHHVYGNDRHWENICVPFQEDPPFHPPTQCK